MAIYVLDSGAFIKKQIFTGKIYTTETVLREIKDKITVDFIEQHYIDINVIYPDENTVKSVIDLIKPLNTNLSTTDIEVISLTYQLYNKYCGDWITPENINNVETVKCITYDNGIKSVLDYLGLSDYFENNDKYFKYRCFGCFKIYETNLDFCKACGHKTVTRVAFIKVEGKEIMCLRKNYTHKVKVIKDAKGNEIKSEDIPEYAKYKKYLKRVNK